MTTRLNAPSTPGQAASKETLVPLATPSQLDIGKLKATFETDGYLILPSFYTSEEIDSLKSDILEKLENSNSPITVDDLVTGQRVHWSCVKQNAVHRNFKFNDLYLLSPAVREIAMSQRLSLILSTLLNDKAVLCNSLNFAMGSQQPPHVDSLYMTPETPNCLVASWIAIEDVRPEAGPMSYYPGSHRIPRYIFSNGSRHAIPEEMPAWEGYMKEQIESMGLVPRNFLANKGDVFIWHSELLHGGSQIQDKSKTRQSLVCHYYGEQDSLTLKSTLEPINSGFWMHRLPCGVIATENDFTAETFPEQTYLTRHPDVAAAVGSGQLESGFGHWRRHGLNEGRVI